MKYKFLQYLILLNACLILLTACLTNSPKEHDLSFTEIDYTFDSGGKDAFSLIIHSNSDCIIAEGRSGLKYYFCKISDRDLLELNDVVDTIVKANTDSIYHNDIVDQASYKIVLILKNGDTLSKFVYGNSAPQPLDNLSKKLQLIHGKLKLVEIDTTVNFRSRIDFLPPSINDSNLIFHPPPNNL